MSEIRIYILMRTTVDENGHHDRHPVLGFADPDHMERELDAQAARFIDDGYKVDLLLPHLNGLENSKIVCCKDGIVKTIFTVSYIHCITD